MTVYGAVHLRARCKLTPGTVRSSGTADRKDPGQSNIASMRDWWAWSSDTYHGGSDAGHRSRRTRRWAATSKRSSGGAGLNYVSSRRPPPSPRFRARGPRSGPPRSRRPVDSRPAGRADYQFTVLPRPAGRMAQRSRDLARPSRLAPNSERPADGGAGTIPRAASGRSGSLAAAWRPMDRPPAASGTQRPAYRVVGRCHGAGRCGP